jgi:hypothetical protein
LITAAIPARLKRRREMPLLSHPKRNLIDAGNISPRWAKSNGKTERSQKAATARKRALRETTGL